MLKPFRNQQIDTIAQNKRPLPAFSNSRRETRISFPWANIDFQKIKKKRTEKWERKSIRFCYEDTKKQDEWMDMCMNRYMGMLETPHALRTFVRRNIIVRRISIEKNEAHIEVEIKTGKLRSKRNLSISGFLLFILRVVVILNVFPFFILYFLGTWRNFEVFDDIEQCLWFYLGITTDLVRIQWKSKTLLTGWKLGL